TLKRSRIHRAAGTLVCAALALSVALAAAQSYPSKPIRLLLPFAGGTDAVARLLAFKLSPALGEQVLPEQRLGAGGNIAHRAAAEAPPDGYTLLMGAPPLVINPHLNPTAGYDALRAFAPVAPLTSIANVLVVHPKVKAASLAELLKLAREAPGKLTYGSGGVGSVNHLAAELLKSRAKIDILHVPYKSATTALTGLIAGEIDVVIVAASSAASYVKDGRLRALAVLDSRRPSALQNGGMHEKSSSCPRDGTASRSCDRGGESRLGLSGHAQARAPRQRRAEADAREREEIHAGADRRRLQSARLVSRRASADAGDRRRREKAGARVRALPSSDG